MWLRPTFCNSIYLEFMKNRKIVVPCWFQQCFEPANTLITEWGAEARPFRRLSKLYLSEAIISVIIRLRCSSWFSERCKFHPQLRNTIKNWQKVFRFWDKVVWNCCQKICILRREYLSSGVNVLTNSVKISDVTKAAFFQLNIFRILGKREKSWCRVDFSSVSNPLTRWLPNGVLKQDLLDA